MHLYIAVPMVLMAMAFVELDECISLYFFFFFFLSDFMSRKDVIWISAPELSYIFSSPGQSPGRAIVLPPVSALALAKC